MYPVALQTPSLCRMALIVTGFHLLIVAGSWWQVDKVIQPSPVRLVVHTMMSSSPPSSVTVKPLPVAESNASQKINLQDVAGIEETVLPKVEASVPKIVPVTPIAPIKEMPKPSVQKVVKKPETKPKVEPKPQVQSVKKESDKKTPPVTVESKKAPSLDKKTLQELQKGLQDAHALDIATPAAAPSTSSSLSLPQLSSKTPSGSSMLSAQAEEDYISQLKGYLHASLRLPDVGEVTIGLRLTAQGRVVGVDVLKKTSIVNEQYVLTHVPTLSFPSWGKGVEEKYFPVTLRSK